VKNEAENAEDVFGWNVEKGLFWFYSTECAAQKPHIEKLVSLLKTLAASVE